MRVTIWRAADRLGPERPRRGERALRRVGVVGRPAGRAGGGVRRRRPSARVGGRRAGRPRADRRRRRRVVRPPRARARPVPGRARGATCRRPSSGSTNGRRPTSSCSSRRSSRPRSRIAGTVRRCTSPRTPNTSSTTSSTRSSRATWRRSETKPAGRPRARSTCCSPTADRLARDPGDATARNELFDLAAQLDGRQPPFGVTVRVWSHAVTAAQTLVDDFHAAEHDPSEVIGHAQDLRTIVRPYV